MSKHKNTSRRLFVEQLEGREVPSVVVSNTATRRLDALPGDTDKVVAKFQVSTTNKSEFVQLKGVRFTSDSRGGPLSGNTSGLNLWWDADGKKSNGYEVPLAQGAVNAQTDEGYFSIPTAVWSNRSHRVHLQFTANFGWRLPNDQMGLKLVKANFDDIFGAPVPDDQVIYRGRKPTLHKLETEALSIVQKQMTAFATTYVGARVKLAEFWMGSVGVSSAMMKCFASQGSLAHATDYTLVHTNWSGVRDVFIPGTVVNSRLSFNFGDEFQGGDWEIMATISGPVGSYLQLALPMDGTLMSAWGLDGHRLKGFWWNTNGGGQIQVSGQSNYGTDYTVR